MALGPGDRVPDAKPGEPGDLRERPKRDHGGIAAHEVDAVGGVGIVAEVAVGLVQDHERRLAAQRADRVARASARGTMVEAGLWGVQTITALVRGVTRRCMSSRSVS